MVTIKSRIKTITRLFRIAYETKNYELYEKYSSLVLFLTREFEDDEFEFTNVGCVLDKICIGVSKYMSRLLFVKTFCKYEEDIKFETCMALELCSKY